MTAIEALNALAKLKGKDVESDHAKADDILVAFLKDHDPACADVAKAYEAVQERCGGFWYA